MVAIVLRVPARRPRCRPSLGLSSSPPSTVGTRTFFLTTRTSLGLLSRSIRVTVDSNISNMKYSLTPRVYVTHLSLRISSKGTPLPPVL